MAATEDQIALVRSRCNVTTDEYSDAALAAYIERYPLFDARGEAPVKYDLSASPPTQSQNENWIPTYDLNLACADVWEEKAAALAGEYDFASDDQRFNRSQIHTQALKMVRYFRSKRAPASMSQFGLSRLGGTQQSYVINAPEQD